MNYTLRTALVAALTSVIVTTVSFVALERIHGEIDVQEHIGQMAQDPIRERIVEQTSDITATVQIVEPSVVSVIVTKDLPILERYYVNPFGNRDPFFDEFFNFGVPQYREKGTERKEVGGGTAFFISKDGLLLTNKHVVSDEEATYTVLLNDETKLDAEVVASDPGNDIAILKVDGKDFSALSLAPEDSELKLGQSVVAIGNALGEFRNTISTGVISGLSRTITAGSASGRSTERLDRIIQTDAAINRGNSGGPLVNLAGQVIGMNTAIASSAQNVGFALHFSDLRRALQSYREHGKITRPFLGIRYMPITEELREKNSLPYDYGVLIVRGEDPTDLAVIPGSPADIAGLSENDIILEFDGEKLTPENPLASLVQNMSPGDEVTLKVFSRGEEKEVEVTLKERE